MSLKEGKEEVVLCTVQDSFCIQYVIISADCSVLDPTLLPA